MNGNPASAQKRYHNELRSMYYEDGKPYFFGEKKDIAELHHVFGQSYSPQVLKDFDIMKAGEWLVIMLPRTIHVNIKKYAFEVERDMFLIQQKDYENHFGKPSPVPEKVVQYYEALLSKQFIVREL